MARYELIIERKQPTCGGRAPTSSEVRMVETADPMAYVQQTRLALAKDMLRRTEESVLRISEGCGFGSQAHFCRVFRQATGMSPLQYRKQKR